MKILDELIQLSKNSLPSMLIDQKKQGRKVIGFFCSYIPEEIIYAGGMIPLRIRPTGGKETTTADAYMSRLNCTFVRSCLELMVKGSFDLLDGLVFTNSCDNIRRLYDILREKRPYPFLHFMSVPHKADSEGAVNWYKEEVTHFKEKMENAFGIKISKESLKGTIDVYNETRSLLKKLYELRKEMNPPVTGAETLSVILCATASPKDQFNQLLRKLLEELSGRKGISHYRARLMIVGSEYDDPAYTKIIEDLGGLVVTDSLCLGSRYFWEPIKIEKDVLEGLTKSYLSRPSCPRMSDRVMERATFIKKMIQDFKVDGVIFQKIRYCDLWGGEALYLQRIFEESGFPWLTLEREYTLSSIGQLKTRVQAFLERIERG